MLCTARRTTKGETQPSTSRLGPNSTVALTNEPQRSPSSMLAMSTGALASGISRVSTPASATSRYNTEASR